jgi:hypothetical protein
MPNELILNLAISGDQDAKEERLIREIMSVDNLEWDQAKLVFDQMLILNRKYQKLYNIPY